MIQSLNILYWTRALVGVFLGILLFVDLKTPKVAAAIDSILIRRQMSAELVVNFAKLARINLRDVHSVGMGKTSFRFAV